MLLSLFKIQLISLYRAMLLRGNVKNKKVKPLAKVLIALLIIYVTSSVVFSVGLMFFTLAKGLIPAGLGWVYFAFAGVVSFSASVMFTVFMSQSLLFGAKDNELLLSLPIKPANILGSRLLALALSEYLSTTLFLIPAGAIYAYLAQPSALFYVMFIITTALLPLLSMTVAGFFGYIISAITKKMRNKSLVVTLFSLLLLGLYMWGYTSLMGGINRLAERGASLGTAIKNTLPPFYYFGQALQSSSIVSLLLFALWCLLPFSVMYFLLSKSFFALSSAERLSKKLSYREGKFKSGSAFSALLKKEIGKFLNTPMYLLNSGLSFFLNLALGIYFFIKGPEMLGMLMSGAAVRAVPSVIALMCFLAAMAFTTAPSVSLEGKNLWILKSSPLDVRDIFNAKLALNCIFGLGTLFFAGACIIIKLRPSVTDALFIILLPFSVQIFTALEGLICNLFFPKLDAANDTIVVKQSMSVIAAMIVSFALIAVMIIAYITLKIPFVQYGAGAFLIINILNAAAYRFIITKGVVMFNSLLNSH